MMVQKPLQGQVVILTGAGRGIGRAAAHMLAGAGARLVLAARTAAEIETVAAEIRAAGGDAIAVPTDVSVQGQCVELVMAALEQFGQIDILINNAAVLTTATLRDLTAEQIKRMVEVNLYGPIFMTQAVTEHMIARGGGQILSLTSEAAQSLLVPGLSAYGATKAGVEQFTRLAAVELSKYGIRVNALNPGAVDTPMLRNDLLGVPPEKIGIDLVAYMMERFGNADVLPPEAPAMLMLWVLTQPELTGQVVSIMDAETRVKAGFPA